MSGLTTVFLERIGFSALHVSILALCSVALLLSMELCLPAFHNLRRNVPNRKCMTMYALLILCPNICVCVAFGLWSSEGIFSEQWLHVQAQTAYEHMIRLMAVVIAVSVIRAVILATTTQHPPPPNTQTITITTTIPPNTPLNTPTTTISTTTQNHKAPPSPPPLNTQSSPAHLTPNNHHPT
ncbi:hypothetical protein KOW79_002862 [Hemibagrus wyckioides]|uniref:Transmembrane protein n=1 Tax=Hemibagrus wyckioides TaxID=337641 RepID=A0A9D3P7H3_9TELE|nr:hypothetical protein KOW79_002862 [Hemibagrus wyckioides]